MAENKVSTVQALPPPVEDVASNSAVDKMREQVAAEKELEQRFRQGEQSQNQDNDFQPR